ncbi:MAG: DUF512 domain-containing protein [Clostridia bacterium]|nr:DUF512 domain-containing protein [Clostridia bacterium]
MNMAYVLKVDKHSIASEVGITEGDLIVSVNGKSIHDIFDYHEYIQERDLLLKVQKPDKEIWEIEIEKEEDEDLGITFENDLIDCEKSCHNKCIFCFIDQLPKGMRETLYFKDDDSRLSFLTGNYVTLTNMSMDDMKRIVRLRMSPINISVHTTNQELRKTMLNNRFAGDILDKIEFLAVNGIEMNTQIVLCKGINDGEELQKTISDLSKFYPNVKSLSVVPVGISRFREGLYPLEPFTEIDSKQVVSLIEATQKKLKQEIGVNFVYIADEFYIKSKTPFPEASEYDDFPQIENGVGLVTSLQDEITLVLNTRKFSNRKRTVNIATGELVYPFISEISKKIMAKYDKIKINIFMVKNKYFGENITVTGLLTGNDILETLKEKRLEGDLLLSRSMFKADEEIFLDNMTLETLRQELNRKILIVNNDGDDFVSKIVKGV